MTMTDGRDGRDGRNRGFADALRELAHRVDGLAEAVDGLNGKSAANASKIEDVKRDVAKLFARTLQQSGFTDSQVKVLTEIIAGKEFRARLRRGMSFYVFGTAALVGAIWAIKEPLAKFYYILKGMLP